MNKMKNKPDEVAIKVDGVSKSFKLPHEKHGSIKNALFSIFKGGKRSYEKQEVLKNINFEIKKGEFFGIVGRNGSGKSTLLKLMAGVYSPDKGAITINGKLTPFIELGVGFNPELTGRENVFLNGSLLGFNRAEMEAMYDEIVEFAELDRFMDQKLKNYSSGMQVRLAFSIAIRARSDILLLDEVLAVGDEAFQRKCFQYFAELKKNRRTVILVTHDMSAIQRFCNRAVLINNGSIINNGKPSIIAAKYSELNLDILESYDTKKDTLTKEEIFRFGNGDAEINFRIQNNEGKEQDSFSPNQKIVLVADIYAKVKLVNTRVGVVIQNSEGNTVFATNTLVQNIRVPLIKKAGYMKVAFSVDNIFTDGIYTLSGAIASNDDETIYSRVEHAIKFTSGGWAMKHALIHPPHKIIIKNT